MTLGGHNQKKRKKTRYQTSAGWIGTLTQPHNVSPRDSTVQSDWHTDTDGTTPLGQRLTTFSISCSRYRVQPRTNRETWKTDRTTVVPLQHHTLTDRVKPPDPDHTHRLPRHVRSSAVGFHTRRLTSRDGLATPASALRVANSSIRSLPG